MAKARTGRIVDPTPIKEEEEISESYISIGLGLLVVVVVGILLYNYFTQRGNQAAQTPSETPAVTEEATTSAQPGTTYKVQSGDTLWSIAEKSYNDGYKWTEIAKANNLSGNEALEAGQDLKIPELAMAQSSPEAPVMTASPTLEASPVVQASPSPAASPIVTAPETPQQTITGTSYVISRGDTLWSIACRAYGDCYAWTKVYQANKEQISNPDLIFAGNTLNLPR